MHMKMPSLLLAHLGCFVGQSAQIWFSGFLSSTSRRFFKPSGLFRLPPFLICGPVGSNPESCDIALDIVSYLVRCAVLDILLPRVVDPNSRAHGTSYTNQVYDVKTCGHRIFNESKRWSCGYGVPCPKKTPVQFMEDAVPSRSQNTLKSFEGSIEVVENRFIN